MPEITSAASGWRRAIGWFDSGEPHPTRGPFARWPRTTDAALAVLVFAGSLVTVAASALGDDFSIGSTVDHPIMAFMMLGAAAGALLWRRQQPVAVAAVVILWQRLVVDFGNSRELPGR